jgi:hypothetical protein
MGLAVGIGLGIIFFSGMHVARGNGVMAVSNPFAVKGPGWYEIGLSGTGNQVALTLYTVQPWLTVSGSGKLVIGGTGAAISVSGTSEPLRSGSTSIVAVGGTGTSFTSGTGPTVVYSGTGWPFMAAGNVVGIGGTGVAFSNVASAVAASGSGEYFATTAGYASNAGSAAAVTGTSNSSASSLSLTGSGIFGPLGSSDITFDPYSSQGVQINCGLSGPGWGINWGGGTTNSGFFANGLIGYSALGGINAQSFTSTGSFYGPNGSLVLQGGTGSVLNAAGVHYIFPATGAGGIVAVTSNSGTAGQLGLSQVGPYAVSGSGSPIVVTTVPNNFVLTSTSFASNAYREAADANWLVTVGYGSGILRSFSLANPATPVSTGTVALGALGNHAIVSGTLAYVIVDPSKLLVYGLRSGNPILTGSATVSAGTNLTALAQSGNWLYASGAGPDAFAKINVTNPASPSVISISSTDNYSEMAVSGNYLYAAQATGSDVDVYSISNSGSTVTPVGSYPDGAQAQFIGVSGTLVATGETTDNIVRVFTSNGGALTQESEIPGQNNVQSTRIYGNLLFISNVGLAGPEPTNSVAIWDLTNPSLPMYRGSVMSSAPADTVLSGTNLYISSELGGNPEGYLQTNAFVLGQSYPAFEIVATDGIVKFWLDAIQGWLEASSGAIGIGTTGTEAEILPTGAASFLISNTNGALNVTTEITPLGIMDSPAIEETTGTVSAFYGFEPSYNGLNLNNEVLIGPFTYGNGPGFGAGEYTIEIGGLDGSIQCNGEINGASLVANIIEGEVNVADDSNGNEVIGGAEYFNTNQTEAGAPNLAWSGTTITLTGNLAWTGTSGGPGPLGVGGPVTEDGGYYAPMITGSAQPTLTGTYSAITSPVVFNIAVPGCAPGDDVDVSGTGTTPAGLMVINKGVLTSGMVTLTLDGDSNIGAVTWHPFVATWRHP